MDDADSDAEAHEVSLLQRHCAMRCAPFERLTPRYSFGFGGRAPSATVRTPTATMMTPSRTSRTRPCPSCRRRFRRPARRRSFLAERGTYDLSGTAMDMHGNERSVVWADVTTTKRTPLSRRVNRAHASATSTSPTTSSEFPPQQRRASTISFSADRERRVDLPAGARAQPVRQQRLLYTAFVLACGLVIALALTAMLAAGAAAVGPPKWRFRGPCRRRPCQGASGRPACAAAYCCSR